MRTMATYHGTKQRIRAMEQEKERKQEIGMGCVILT